MAAGDSAEQVARQREKLALRMLASSRRYEVGAVGEREVAASLQPLLELGWTVLEDRSVSIDSAANIDLIAVGPGGVVVIDAKNWYVRPRLVGTRLMREDQDCGSEIERLLAVTTKVELAVAELGISPLAVTAMMAFAGHRINTRHRRVRLIGGRDAAKTIAGLSCRLNAPAVRKIVAHLSAAFPQHASAPADGHGRAAADESMTLFDVYEVLVEHERSAREGPIEEWMTFLHPEQHALVRRNWNGPARISGPAGTGKSVVGLHRAAHLARRTGGRVLFVTFVNSLPRVQANLLARLAPDVAGRVEFRSLHSWAMSLLARRRQRVEIDRKGAESSFNLAWSRMGRDLGRLDSRLDYWRDEIGLIKGRGLRSLDEYLQVERHGRRMPLHGSHREAVWRLFSEYQRLCQDRGIGDFADALSAALASVRERPLDDPYAAVIVDEVQDLSLNGIKLLHALVGDAPNGLLLIGDERQAVYAGGYRLAEAGISVRGARSHVLRVNYRNGHLINAAGENVLGGLTVENVDAGTPLDGAAVEIANGDGRVVDVAFASLAQLHSALIEAVQEVGDAAASAVLCCHRADVARYRKLLSLAGIPTCDLETYRGTHVDAVKVGTFKRSKGLEFKHVFLPRYDQALVEARRGEAADADRLELATKQLHVAVTRPRDTLWRAQLLSEGKRTRPENQAMARR